ncbi:putative actin [Cyclospora cayetanensis]|uniref:Actin n=1 Tax=Cyclospora cayetanensis TaxID=88456 RepID=A0A1D3D8S9_9EIME|nr:putative actin [Cyclospora cayetanensis]
MVSVTNFPQESFMEYQLAIWLSDILKGCAARSPYEKPVLLLEGVLTPPYLKHKVTELLLNYFQVPGVSFLSDLVAPLYTCGVDTGLVVDIGFTSCRVQPTCFGTPLPCALRVSSGGAAAVLQQLQHALTEAAASTPAEKRALKNMNLEELEDMAVKVLYVRYDLSEYRQQQPHHDQRLKFESSLSLQYIAKDGTAITVPAELRWRCVEVLLGSLPPEETAVDVGQGLVDLILSSLHSCPAEARRLAVQNIILCGGFSSLRGLSTRLSADLQSVYGQAEWVGRVPLPDWASTETTTPQYEETAPSASQRSGETPRSEAPSREDRKEQEDTDKRKLGGSSDPRLTSGGHLESATCADAAEEYGKRRRGEERESGGAGARRQAACDARKGGAGLGSYNVLLVSWLRSVDVAIIGEKSLTGKIGVGLAT